MFAKLLLKNIEFNFVTIQDTVYSHKKVSRDLTKKKQDLTEMSIILMVLTEIYARLYLSKILS